MMGALIAHKAATLEQLETYYSYRDAMDMMEIITVTQYNEWLSNYNAEQRAKQNGNSR